MHPLSNIRVVEIANFLAGPFCSMQLADLGADVIKVEPPNGGDKERASAPFINGEGSGFMRFNRNKQSVAIDLKTEEGIETACKLIDEADILVQNLRPGSMDRLGLGYEAMHARNPGLIYISASGWGQSGPLALHPGLDIMAQARSGMISVTGPEGGEGVKVGFPVCDLVCGIYGALGAVAALQARNETGLGQHIDVNLFESGMSLAVWEAARYFANGDVPVPQGTAHAISAPYQVLKAAGSSSFAVGAVTPSAFEALCTVTGTTELLDDERYVDKNTRRAHRNELVAALEAATTTKPASHWVAELEKAGVPCAPVQSYDQSFNDEHLLAREFFWDSEHPAAGRVRQMGSAMSFSETPTRRDSAGPMLGEHTRSVLSDLGYAPDRIDMLLESEVIAQAEVPTAQEQEAVPAHA